MVNFKTNQNYIIMTDQTKTQLNQVLDHLLAHQTITSWQAIQKYGITRLSARIYDLKVKGFYIDTVSKRNAQNTGNYGLYILTDQNF